MNSYSSKTPPRKDQSVSGTTKPSQLISPNTNQFIDNRAEVIAQRKLQEATIGSHQTQQSQLIQKKQNNTGLPDNLKSGIEGLSGFSMDDVQVFRNSDKPAQLQAHAYAQGSNIHVAPGQEQHLPHEVWHVVQQKQGRVRPTMQTKGGMKINNDAGLEQEADVMGQKALSVVAVPSIQMKANTSESGVAQLKWDYVDDTLMGWDEDLGGLSWFYDMDNGFMSFLITDQSPDYMEILKVYEGKPRPYNEWVEIWKENDWPTDGFEDIHKDAQSFGTDIPKKGNALISEPKERSKDEKLEILVKAMKAGYTLFDTAELYCTSDLIGEAAKLAGIDVSTLTIVYKAMPVNDEKESGSLEENVLNFRQRVRYQMSSIPAKSQKVLMLHELPKNEDHISAYIDALYDIAVGGDAGMVKSLGVSNVTFEQLQKIHQYAIDKKIMRIKYVENRFSPAEQDSKVREFCTKNGITYMAYGLFGGSSTGFCSEGFAMPKRHLQMLQDGRLIKLADEIQLSVHQMLLAWANAKGVTTIIYSGGHAKSNFEAQKIQLHQNVVDQIDSFFIYKEGETDSEFKDESDVAGLYATLKDSSAWYIFDTLLKDDKVMSLFKVFLSTLSDQYGPGAKDYILNFGMRLVRLVTHLQTMYSLDEYQEPWDIVLVKSFKKIAVASESVDGVMEKLYEWSQKEYMEVGGATHAEEHLDKIAKGHKEEDPSIGDQLDLTQANCAVMDDFVVPRSFSEFQDGATGWHCQYAPNGLTKKPIFKLKIKVISHTDSGATVEVTGLSW